MGKFLISVIIRSYKRKEIKDCLLNLIANRETEDVEIIVVDNTISGYAKEIVEKIRKMSNIPIKYFIQPIISASKTANLGIEKSEGEIIAFIDDDAIPEKNWIKEIKETFVKEGVDIVGGKVLLKYPEKEIPSWINGELEKTLGKVDLGDRFRKMKRKEFPVLMNFAIRKKVFEKIGKFPEKLGYQKDKFFGSEETAFAILARKKGYQIYYNPDMIVYHQITPERLKRRYFLRKKFWEGRALFVMNKMFYPVIFIIFIFIFRTFIVIPILTASLFLTIFSPKKEALRIIILCKIFRNLGYFLQSFQIY